VTNQTVDWTAMRDSRAGAPKAEGLRERKKRLMRQQLTDTATELFVERGFDAVRVVEIAAACGVSEQTVFNYFATKESLILDRPAATMDALRSGLADPTVTPVQAVLRILDDEVASLTSWLAAQDDLALAISKMRRFDTLIQTTPSLRAYQLDMTDQLVAVAAEALAARAGVGADEPEPQIAATALTSLWTVQLRMMGKHLAGTPTAAQLRKALSAEARRAARLLEGGLDMLAFGEQGADE
jgi:AcrR family transcriptional regulator